MTSAFKPQPKKGRVAKSGEAYRAWRNTVFTRDGWQCAVIYPGGTRCNDNSLTLHHIIFRSKQRLDEDWNAISICAYHHQMVTIGRIKCEGRAPNDLKWFFVGDPNETRDNPDRTII